MSAIHSPRRPGRVLVLLLCAALLGLVAPSPAAAERDTSGVLVVKTVPSTPGARVAADGVIATANSNGRIRLPIRNFEGLNERFNVLESRVAKDRKVELDRVVGSPEHGIGGKKLEVGLRTQRLVSWTFVDRGGREVPPERISLLELRSNTGEIVKLRGEDLSRPMWVAAGRTQQTTKGLVNKELYWSVRKVIVDGADVVHRGQQVFIPEQTQDWRISLLFYRVEIVGRDLLFGSLAGEGVELAGPDGTVIRKAFDDQGVALLDNLPRAQYDVHVYGPGVSFTRPMSVSKDQVVEIEVISEIDLGLIVSTIILIAISLVLVGRRHHLIRMHTNLRARLGRLFGAAVVVGLVAAGGVFATAPPVEAAGQDPAPVSSRGMPPVFAYYYIWFQPTSWLRAKTDYPLLGRYSSDDPVVMARHVTMAKEAGLTGFLVSWKDQDHLSSRLRTMVKTAERQEFKLGIIYQGLDFERNTLPVDQIAADLERFADQYGDSPAFDTFEKPVVVITGTEEYSVDELDRATEGVRGRLHILASSKSPEEYQRTASVMDGDAYYWSSGDPTEASHRERLKSIAKVVHDDDGLWFAPAAAGFDARLIGGKIVIPREGGDTLKAAFASARASQPDAVAVISWNEFSENTHIEPSRKHGLQELSAVAELLGGEAKVPAGLDEGNVADNKGLTGWGALVALLFMVALLNFWLAFKRRKQPLDPPTEPALPARHKEGVPS